MLLGGLFLYGSWVRLGDGSSGKSKGLNFLGGFCEKGCSCAGNGMGWRVVAPNYHFCGKGWDMLTPIEIGYIIIDLLDEILNG